MMKTPATLLLLSIAVLAQDPAHDHHAAVDSRGDKVMGFSHEKTAHHFRLYQDGGAIEVEALKAEDTESRDQIRGHLKHLATMFPAGNFSAPMLIHDKTPPGVPVMQKLKADISYEFRETERGAAIDIQTSEKEAIAAIHEFALPDLRPPYGRRDHGFEAAVRRVPPEALR